MTDHRDPGSIAKAEFGPMVRMRRAEGYDAPPGPTRRFDRSHFRRQSWIARLFVGGIAFVILWILAWDAGWLGPKW